MTEITESATVDTDPDTLWREAAGFDAMADWHPLLDRASNPRARATAAW